MLVAIIKAMRIKDMGRDINNEGFWKLSAGEIHEYFVPKDVEGRKAVHLDTLMSSSAARKQSAELSPEHYCTSFVTLQFICQFQFAAFFV
jgi:hypothetical protein